MSWIRKSTLSWLQLLAVKILKTGQIPRHIAIIMDGNRRYANKAGVEKTEGHVRGFDKLAETLQWCADLGIPEVTVYAFSIENFKRSKEEVDVLMDLAAQKFKRLLDEKDKLMEHGVCIRVIGNLTMIPEDVRKPIAEAMTITKDNNKAFLNVAFAYTSRDEITHAIKDIMAGVKTCDVHPDEVDENLISNCLYTYKSPDPDLLIRTSGEVRFSDFLMWQISSTCVYFANVLWPEFSAWDLFSAVFYYQRCYADLQRATTMRTTKCSVQSSRVSSYVDKLQHIRHSILEDMSSMEVSNIITV